jgi:hypothetical protein
MMHSDSISHSFLVVYDQESLNCDYNDLGFFDQTKPENALQLFELIIQEMVDIRDGNFSTDEFERAK